LPRVTDPKVLVGTSSADDAAVYRLSDELALVQTVDFFTPIVDDPYAFGAIAAANSLSDVYAMGGRPLMALNVVGFPRASEDAPMSVLREILRGGAEKAKEAGIDILGGHTIDDVEPKYGLAVSGLVHPERIWRNVGGQPTDKLVLTKPLGTGIIATAIRAEQADPDHVAAAVASMATLNRAAAEAAIEAGVEIHACTDITGFGLLGHLREMLGSGGVGARIHAREVPVLDGARALASAGHVPGGSNRNRDSLRGVVSFDAGASDEDQIILCDAQSSGGLLFAVPAPDCDALIAALHQNGVATAVEVGQLTSEHPGLIEVAR
jgi:selenide,water dikinase